jgi:hypothetical protein
MVGREPRAPKGETGPELGLNTSLNTTLVDSAVDKRPGARGIVADGGRLQYPDTEIQVTKLETHMEYIRRDLEEIKASNKSILEKLDIISHSIAGAKAETDKSIAASAVRVMDAQTIVTQNLSSLPNRRDLYSYALIAIAISLATIAIVVGGLIGGLSWIKDSY